MPNWTIGSVDSIVSSKYRTFDIADSTVYSFLMSDVEDAYECIVDYDIENFTINVYDKNNYINNTSVYLSKAETNKSIKIEQVSEQVVTALSVFGQNDLDISMINVIGGNVIYNFDYYKNTDWMSQTLINAINDWENKIQTYQATYNDKLLSLLNQNAILQTKKSELSQLQSDLKYLNVQKSAIISDNKQNNLTSINSLISQKTTQINTKKAEVTTVQNDVTTLQNDIIAINNTCAIKNNFSEVLYNELFPYIIESTYKDEYITVTDSMTFAQRQNQAKELYNKGVNILNKLSQPTYNISLQTNNFLFNSDYKDYLSQIQTGVLINIEVSDDNFQQFVLLKIPTNFSTKECSFEFSNRFRLSDPSSVYNDLYKSVSSSANTVNFEKSIWGEAVKSGKLDDVVNFTKAPLDLTNNAIKSSNGQSMVIDDTGLNGLATLEDGSISPEQLKIVNNALAFTNDNFETLKTAIGKIYLPDGQLIDGKNYVYGICADYISGNLIAGNGLIIKTADGKFIIDDNGFRSEQVDNIENNMVTIGQVDTRIESAITQSEDEVKVYVNEKTALNSHTYTTAPNQYKSGDLFILDRNYITSQQYSFKVGQILISTSDETINTHQYYTFGDGTTLKFIDETYFVSPNLDFAKWDKKDKYQTDTDVSASLQVQADNIKADFQNGGLSSQVKFDVYGQHIYNGNFEVWDKPENDSSKKKVFGVSNDTGNLEISGDIKDIDGNILIGKSKGVLSTLVFSGQKEYFASWDIGVDETGGNGLTNANTNITVNVPDNFIIIDAKINIILYPIYYVFNAISGWGYPRNIKCYLDNNYLYSCGIAAGYTPFSPISINPTDISQYMFNASSFTPIVNQGWNPNSTSTQFATEKTSSDIKSLLNVGKNLIQFKVASIPNESELDVSRTAKYSGFMSAKVVVNGYRKW